MAAGYNRVSAEATGTDSRMGRATTCTRRWQHRPHQRILPPPSAARPQTVPNLLSEDGIKHHGKTSALLERSHYLLDIWPRKPRHQAVDDADPHSFLRGIVILQARVTPVNAAGNVQFKDGSHVIATAPVVFGSAGPTIAILAPGSHSITATFVPSNPAATQPSTSPPPVTFKF